MAKHVWVAVSATASPTDEVICWCIRCGALKVGRHVYLPGPGQSKDLLPAPAMSVQGRRTIGGSETECSGGS